MKLRSMVMTTVLIGSFLMSGPAPALTMNQFVSICEAAGRECSEHPLLNAYVGGALDLIAMLDEETDYLSEVYCKPTKELFDVPEIIRYMEIRRTEYADRNAMLVLIRYLEEQGGCTPG
ncbi:MAG: hypothetical protein AAFX56_09745 [Pseudomonadota bacterium]